MKERDLDKNPYTSDEQRVVDYIYEKSNQFLGGGDDPIGFLIASHNLLSWENQKFRNYFDNSSIDADEILEYKDGTVS